MAVVDVLLKAGAQLEAQSERTKDTVIFVVKFFFNFLFATSDFVCVCRTRLFQALSLACSGGRKEVVELLLKAGANKEHRNVSDYTPLSLAGMCLFRLYFFIQQFLPYLFQHLADMWTSF